MSASDVDLYRDAFEKLLMSACDERTIRAIEAGESPRLLWSALEESGFLEALVPEKHGGAGLSLRQAMPLLIGAGAAAVPLPVGHTLIARAVLSEAGMEAPAGSITFSRGTLGKSGEVDCHGVP